MVLMRGGLPGVSSSGLVPCNNGKLPPLPKAFRIGEAQTVQPGQMVCDRDQLVRGIVLVGATPNGGEEFFVPPLGGRRHVLDVGEDAARAEPVEQLAVERPLAL